MSKSTSKSRKNPAFESDKELMNFLLSNLANSLKEAIKVTVKTMIKHEMEQLRNEVEEKLSFNGYYHRHMVSPIGKINNINIPRFREKPMNNLPLKSMHVFASEQERFHAIVAAMHRVGVSHRKIEKLTKLCFGVTMSKNKSSAIHQDLAKQEALNINSKPLTDEFEYLLLDGLFVKAKQFGLASNNKVLLLCALGITKAGERKIIGFDIAPSEAADHWQPFVEQLKERGLLGKNLKLIICDDNGGLLKATKQIYPHSKLQVCITHKMRNVVMKTSHKHKSQVGADLKHIYQARTKSEAQERMKSFCKRWYIKEQPAVESLRFDFDRTLTYLEFPKHLWSKIRTTNILERTFREVRRRIKVFDSSFHDNESLKHYGNSIFSYLNDHYPASLHTKS